MSSKNISVSLDTKLIEWIPAKRAPVFPAFGVEIELENCEFRTHEPVYNDWSSKAEGSLRNNGAEFITYGPKAFVDRSKILGQVPAMLKYWISGVPDMSIRCSTHIHINVAYLTLRQVFTASFLYYLFENALVKTQSKHRQGNLFCLRMKDAMRIGSNLVNSAKEPSAFSRIFSQGYVKYSALNLATVTKMGTMEYRFLSPTVSVELLNFWVEVFQSIADYASKNTPKGLIKDYDTLDLIDFMRKVWGTENAARLYQMFTKNSSYEVLTSSIHKNYDTVVEVSKVLHNKKFELSPKYWNPDDESAMESMPGWASDVFPDFDEDFNAQPTPVVTGGTW